VALFGRTDLIVILLAVAACETTAIVRAAVETAAQVTAATERLDELDADLPSRPLSWPTNHSLIGRAISVSANGRAIVTNLTVVIAPDRRIAITGPNGSGKSTLLRVLAALDDADAGEVTVGSVSLSAVDDTDVRHHLGYVSAEPKLTSGVAVRVLRAGRPIDVDTSAIMREVGMTAESATRWTNLSRGEAMRVALVRQLASAPDILVLDEPTSGLGPTERVLVLERLRQFTGTLVCATHDDDVIAMCDEILVLRDGSLTTVE